MAHGGGFVAQSNQVGMKKTGETVTIPNHPKARLSYYLKSVATVLQLDNPNLARLKNYRNYENLSEDETDDLLKLIVLLSPDELIGKVFFQSDALCGDSNNEFYELEHVSHTLAVTNSVMIGGQRKRVAEIMTFKTSWMEQNYLAPLRSYQDRLSRLARGLPGYESPRVQHHEPPRAQRRTKSPSECAIL